jgi:hypothetical protein
MTFPTKTEWLDMLWTATRTFCVAAIGQIFAYGAGIFDLSAGDWEGVASSGVAALLMVVVQFFNKGNDKYGLRHPSAPAEAHVPLDAKAVAVDAADVDIKPNPSFVPDVVDADPNPSDVRDNDKEADQ